MSERDVTVERVRAEHLAEVDQRRHWLYLFGVLVGGTASMLGFIALLAGLD